eukprot:scaffold28332_cov31-Tisochrysis_lutea.AAC.4
MEIRLFARLVTRSKPRPSALVEGRLGTGSPLAKRPAAAPSFTGGPRIPAASAQHALSCVGFRLRLDDSPEVFRWGSEPGGLQILYIARSAMMTANVVRTERTVAASN